MNEPIAAFAAYQNGVSANSGTPKKRKHKKEDTAKLELINNILGKKKKEFKRKSVVTNKSFISKSQNNKNIPKAKKAKVTQNSSDRTNNNTPINKLLTFKIQPKKIPAKRKSLQLTKKGHSAKKTKVSNESFGKANSSIAFANSLAHSTPNKRKSMENNKNKRKSAKKIKTNQVKINSALENAVVNIQASPINRKSIKIELKSPNISRNSSAELKSSIEEGKELFSWIIDSISLDDFMNDYWEQKPLLVNRKCPTYYKHLISTQVIDNMLRENRIEFTKNIDITSYRNGVRETHNPIGRALPPTVWDFYRDGCSIRILNPQTFIPNMHAMNATLQEYFQCMTGANVYLTPSNSQGFAPHYDDIEAFVLQIEGRKHWKLYKPRTKEEFLPCTSSGNFKESEIGEPILDTFLEAGDFLYFPRGTIHQANTVPGYHSLHITLSVYQKQTYGDLLRILMPLALESAIQEDVNFRQGLPINIWQNLGLVYSDQTSRERSGLINNLKILFNSLLTNAPIDDAIDKMSLNYQHDALPPFLKPDEKSRMVYNTISKINENGDIDTPQLNANTNIRLTRANILRLTRYENEFRVYFYVDNSKEYHEFDENYLQINSDDAPAIEILVKMYPDYIKVSEMQLASNDRNIEVAQDLWERGLLMTKNQLHFR